MSQTYQIDPFDAKTETLAIEELNQVHSYLAEGSRIAGRERTYEVLGEIGSGSMGTVYLARERGDLHRRYAIKVNKRSHLGSSGRFLRESRILRSLNQEGTPNIPPYVEHMDDQFLVMGFIAGNPLTPRGEELDVPRSVSVLENVGTTLAHAHHLGVVHRDVKPHNIVLPIHQPSLAYLLDWGLSGIRPEDTLPLFDDSFDGSRDHLTGSCAIIGTPLYSPPEVLNRERHTPASDIYSLGVTAYELLSGRLPKVPRKTSDITIRIYDLLHRRITPLHDLVPDVPRRLTDLVMDSLSRQPSHRPTAKEFLEGLRHYQEPVITPCGSRTLF